MSAEEAKAEINDNEEGSEYKTLIEHYKKLIEYKNNLVKTDALLAIEKDAAVQEEINKVKNSLLQAITYEDDVIKFTQNSDNYFFSPNILDSKAIDRLCQVYSKKENKWHNSKIESVDMETQEAEIIQIGQSDRVKVHACFIKLIDAPDPMDFQPGSQCEAIYSNDGRYYPCVIEKITDQGYQIKFKRYNNRETVSLYHLKAVANQVDDFKTPDIGDMKEFKIPDHLKILPNDSEVQRKKKKKKIKALKAAFKNAEVEKVSQEKQTSWTSFTNKSITKKKGHFQLYKNRESIFKSPDTVDGKVGVTGSGKGMTNFREMGRYVFENEGEGGQNPGNNPANSMY